MGGEGTFSHRDAMVRIAQIAVIDGDVTNGSSGLSGHSPMVQNHVVGFKKGRSRETGSAHPGVGSCQSDSSPSRSGIGTNGPAVGYVSAIHVPDRGLAVRVLEKDVGRPFAACSDGMPIWPGI